jgi:hypothetical protein
MMHACASAAKLRGGGPILKAGIAAMGESGPGSCRANLVPVVQSETITNKKARKIACY